MDPKAIVRRGYDKISYHHWSDDGRFQTADISQLTYPDDQFAAVISFYTISHLPLANIYRCRLSEKPGFCCQM